MREANGNGSATPHGVGWFDVWGRVRGSSQTRPPGYFLSILRVEQRMSTKGHKEHKDYPCNDGICWFTLFQRLQKLRFGWGIFDPSSSGTRM